MPASPRPTDFRILSPGLHGGLLLLAVSLAAGCGGKEATGPTAALIATDPGAVTLKGIGTTQTVRATVQDARSLEIKGAAVRWTSASATIASVTQSGNTATVTAVAPGVTQIIAATPDGSISQSVTVTVSAEVNSVTTSVTSVALTIGTGSAQQVSVSSTSDPGVAVTYSWATSNPLVVVVNEPTGPKTLVSLVGVAPGQATVTVSARGDLGGPVRTAQVAVTVSATLQSLANLVLENHQYAQADYIIDLGVLGREVYNWSAPGGDGTLAFVTGSGGRLDPSGRASGQWAGRFANMRNAHALFELAARGSISDGDRHAAQGFARTLLALEWLQVVQTRDTLGGPMDLDTLRTGAWQSLTSLYQQIIQRLDEGYTSLVAAGSTFPFTLPTGWAGFETPSTFRRFNRAIRAKALILYARAGCGGTCYNSAIATLGQSFINLSANTIAQLEMGPYHTFPAGGNGASAVVNSLIFAHPSIVRDATPGDDRVTRKLQALAGPAVAPYASNLTASHQFALYPRADSPLPIIRNEELILLQGEAELALGNIASATQRLNQVRMVSGKGLAPYPLGTAAQTLDWLLYERRMSLLFEGARWVDMRRFGRLSQLPLDRPSEFVAPVMPIPKAECDARSVKPAGC